MDCAAYSFGAKHISLGSFEHLSFGNCFGLIPAGSFASISKRRKRVFGQTLIMKNYINTVNTKILAFSLCIIYLFFPKIAICAVSNNDFNIVLISIDALRADHLSCYSYERETSPNIDKIAEKGILFENVIAPSSWTVPSMVSLFTSVYPINHGVISGFLRNNKVYKQEVLSDNLTTLAEILKENGYATFGVAANLHLSE